VNNAAQPLVVRALICHAHVEMGITCFASLFRCSDRVIDLRLHDDGSLTPEDEAALLRAFPTAKVIKREEADQIVPEVLRSSPRCLEFRRHGGLALKLLDTLAISHEPFLLLDSDVLFFNPFEDLFNSLSNGNAFIYMEDYVYAYTLAPREMMADRELRPVFRLNSGLMLVRPDRVDISFIEHLLGKRPAFRQERLAEQTIWGILAGKYGARKWNERQVTVVNSDFYPSADQVAAHFVSPSRHRLGEFTGAAWAASPGDRVQVQTEEAVPYNSVRMLGAYFGRGITNRLHRLIGAFRPAAGYGRDAGV
jgi:hypothetical protein